MELYEEKVTGVVESILADYQKDRDIDKMAIFNQPDPQVIREIVHSMLKIIYPGYYRDTNYKVYNMASNLTVWIEDVIYKLTKQVDIVLRYQSGQNGIPGADRIRPQDRGDSFFTGEKTGKPDADSPQEGERQGKASYCASGYGDGSVCAAEQEYLFEEQARSIVLEFCSRIPKLREYLDTDLQATLEGDPAALNKDEIVLSYPGLLATTVNRMAHELFLLDVPLIPRMMTEYAHSVTGIDINPAATIGRYFFMDHGTGIVVGSTTIIGEHVKVYQGVTLGALSTSGGQSLRGTKRHPTIEDHVTIYSGASILGGETVIGRGSVIGSNAFITHSIPEGTRVTIKNQELIYKNGKGELLNELNW